MRAKYSLIAFRPVPIATSDTQSGDRCSRTVEKNLDAFVIERFKDFLADSLRGVFFLREAARHCRAAEPLACQG